jgi:hypothetical protein
MNDLIAFLTARLDVAEANVKDTGMMRLILMFAEGSPGADEICRRMLREVEAARAILARYEDCLARMEDPAYSGVAEYVQIREYEDFILPNLAAIWSDHPDYRQKVRR